MKSITLLKKDNYEIIQDKAFQSKTKQEYSNKEFTSKEFSNLSILEMIKDIDSLSLTDFFSIKVDNRLIIYRKSKESKLAVILTTDKDQFNSSQVINMSKVILSILEKKYFSETLNKQHVIDYNLKEILIGCIEDLTVSFLEYLKANKLYAKYIYFNYNPNIASAFVYKKIKQQSASIILYSSGHKNDIEKVTEVKDTLLQRSTIKEKELCIELDKKSFSPCEKRIFIKKYTNLKSDLFKKKNLIKYYSTSFFIEKYVSLSYENIL